MTFIDALLSFVIGLITNKASAKLELPSKAEQQREEIHRALASGNSLEDEVAAAAIRLAKNRQTLKLPQHEQKLWSLLTEPVFQKDLAEWIMAGAITEGDAVKARLQHAMAEALQAGGATAEQLDFLQGEYFQRLDRAFAENPVLAAWRHQLSLDYLRLQVETLRRRADEAAGVYSAEKRREAWDSYCDKALDAWDIIDLTNLPEDIQTATERRYLRELYMPLRIAVDPKDSGLDQLEDRRDRLRRLEAGRTEGEAAESLESTPVGSRLGISQRLVVLGDPGGGKTTLLRWMATAYLLRRLQDPGAAQLPDTLTLPDRPWIPVLIRCRDLGEADLCRSFSDFLAQHLYKTALLPDEAKIMQAVILDGIAKGEVLLLVDGLDEITKPDVRVQFCQELERTAARYPQAPLLVTSRIVGYRDMPYRMGEAFEHGTIATLSAADKDNFVRRWVDVTERHLPAAEKAKRADELREALHSNDRIERMTGNPMLLTTLALVKRKVGKLPTRRTKLYAEAVSVLLNWNPRHYTTLDEDEALPQLEYLAYEMCRRGVQRLPEDDVLTLLDGVREEYRNIRAMKRRGPEEFLSLLEARSSLLIKSGGIWTAGHEKEKPVWEFRHLTFQEYLAARALLDGRYPGRDKNLSLAAQVAPLAGQVKEIIKRRWIDEESWLIKETKMEWIVVESWRETLRLLVADCRDDDVDETLLAILHPLEGEDPEQTARARAVLATLCLADEPNVGEDTAVEVLEAFATQVKKGDGMEAASSSAHKAALELIGGPWLEHLKQSLIQEFLQRPAETRSNPGGLWGMVETALHNQDADQGQRWFEDLVHRLSLNDPVQSTAAALAVTRAAYEGKVFLIPGLIPALLRLLQQSPALRHASNWALWCLRRGPVDQQDRQPYWQPTGDEIGGLLDVLERTSESESYTRFYLCEILGRSGDARVVPPLMAMANESVPQVRYGVVVALGRLQDPLAINSLATRLEDDDLGVRHAAFIALGRFSRPQARVVLQLQLNNRRPENRQKAMSRLAQNGEKTDRRLLSRDLDGTKPWLDPQVPITAARMAEAAERLSLPEAEIRRRYEALAPDFALKLEWL
jgi:hypothetical protein